MRYNKRKYIKGGVFIYKRMQQKYEKMKEQIVELKRQLEHLPEGKLVSGRNGKYYQWFQSDGHTRKYIPQKNKKLIEQLAIKKYLSYMLADAENEKCAIEYYLKHHREDVGKAEHLLNTKSEYREILSPYFQTNSKALQEWLQEPFEQNSQYQENLIFKTISGHTVRSKSEVMIDTLLYINKIPFRYECALWLGKRKIFPDFTIRHPKTGEVYYWEHFGKMGEEEYVKKSCSKIQSYALHGIIPNINLIMTFETSENPLSPEDVMEIIEKYFEIETDESLLQLQFN